MQSSDAVCQVVFQFISASGGPYVVILGGLGMFACLWGVGNFPTPSTSYGIVVFLMEVCTCTCTNFFFLILQTNMFAYWWTQVVLTSEINVTEINTI